MSILAIVGSRTISNYNVVAKFLHQLIKKYSIDTIVSGGAVGIDSVAMEYAKRNKLAYIEHLPDWDLHGKSAGAIRNQLIVDSSDYVVAFWDGKSVGTMITVDMAKKVGKLIKLYKLKDLD